LSTSQFSGSSSLNSQSSQASRVLQIAPELNAEIQNLFDNYSGSSFGSSDLLNALPVVAPSPNPPAKSSWTDMGAYQVHNPLPENQLWNALPVVAEKSLAKKSWTDMRAFQAAHPLPRMAPPRFVGPRCTQVQKNYSLLPFCGWFVNVSEKYRPSPLRPMAEKVTAGLSASLKFYKGCQSLENELRERRKGGMEWVMDTEAHIFNEQSVPDTRIPCKSFLIQNSILLTSILLLVSLVRVVDNINSNTTLGAW
jgi:hypothetical protein